MVTTGDPGGYGLAGATYPEWFLSLAQAFFPTAATQQQLDFARQDAAQRVKNNEDIRASTGADVKLDFLFYEAAVAGAIVGAPLLYRAATGLRRGKKAKADERIALAFDDASNRAVSLLASLGPAIAFPLAYISVQCLENRGVISKGLGDAVQTGMAAAVAGQAASGIGSLISGIAKAF